MPKPIVSESLLEPLQLLSDLRRGLAEKLDDQDCRRIAFDKSHLACESGLQSRKVEQDFVDKLDRRGLQRENLLESFQGSNQV